MIVAKDGETIDPVRLRSWLGQQLAAYKVPRVYQLTDTLPTGSTGKILKRELNVGRMLRDGVRPPRT